MAETSKERVIRRLPSRKTPRETRLPLTISPNNGGGSSQLIYDSYELRAVTYQLNKAMRRSNSSGSSSPAYLCYLKSPFHSQYLDRTTIYRENSRAPKKVLCSHLTCAAINRSCESKRKTKEVSRGFAAKLWNKLKRGLLRS